MSPRSSSRIRVSRQLMCCGHGQPIQTLLCQETLSRSLQDKAISVQALVTAANTNSDGTGNITTPTMYIALTADATNRSSLEFVRFMAVASVAASNTNRPVMRVYVSSITSGATSSANTWLIGGNSAADHQRRPNGHGHELVRHAARVQVARGLHASRVESHRAAGEYRHWSNRIGGDY